MEEYMESELSGIFQVKLVTKNIVCGSPGTQFMHMRVNILNSSMQGGPDILLELTYVRKNREF